jgi:hypothetical protein
MGILEWAFIWVILMIWKIGQAWLLTIERIVINRNIMALNKKQREIIWQKSEGHCWYCGDNLPNKGWHADHFEPVYRRGGELWKLENDVIDNIVPACAPCNLFKSVFSVEEFRREIELQTARARKTSVNFRVAERFGMIELTNEPVIFWYEHRELGL